MNQTHIHLLITHLPIVGTALGALVLIHGIWTKSHATLIAGYNVLILSAVGACIAYATGEGAEETVEHLPGFSDRLIEDHAEAALITLIALIVVGCLALIGIISTIMSSSIARPLSWLVLAASVLAFITTAWTGYLGGKIRHTELGTVATYQNSQRK